MHNIDERISAVKQRTNELKRKQKIRNYKILSITSIAASFIFIVCTALAMPDVMSRLATAQTAQTAQNAQNAMGSVFSSANIIGFVLIALLAFSLGVCVTLLCVHLHYKSKEGK